MPNHHQDFLFSPDHLCSFLFLVFTLNIIIAYFMRITHQFLVEIAVQTFDKQIFYSRFFMHHSICWWSFPIPLILIVLTKCWEERKLTRVISHWIDSRRGSWWTREMSLEKGGRGWEDEEEVEGGWNINKRHVFAVKRCRFLIQEPIIGSDALLIDGYVGKVDI